DYRIRENSVSGWTLKGFALADSNGVCPSQGNKYGFDSGQSYKTVKVKKNQITVVCVLNEKNPPATVIVKKVVKDGTASGVTFGGEIGNQSWTITGSGTAGTYQFEPGSLTVTETNVPDSWELKGFYVS